MRRWRCAAGRPVHAPSVLLVFSRWEWLYICSRIFFSLMSVFFFAFWLFAYVRVRSESFRGVFSLCLLCLLCLWFYLPFTSLPLLPSARRCRGLSLVPPPTSHHTEMPRVLCRSEAVVDSVGCGGTASAICIYKTTLTHAI